MKILNIKTNMDIDVKWIDRAGGIEQLGSLIQGTWLGAHKHCTMVFMEYQENLILWAFFTLIFSALITRDMAATLIFLV